MYSKEHSFSAVYPSYYTCIIKQNQLLSKKKVALGLGFCYNPNTSCMGEFDETHILLRSL